MAGIEDVGWIGDLGVRIDRSGDAPPWPFQVRDAAAAEWQEVGRGAWQLIDEVIVPIGGAATISFASIPGHYRRLSLEMMLKGTASDEFDVLYLKVNGDGTAAHYMSNSWYWSSYPDQGSSRPVPTAAGALVGYVSGTTTAHPDAWGFVEIDFPFYSSTLSQKCFKGHTTTAASYAPVTSDLFDSYWLSTAAINALLLSLGSGNFAAGGKASLYGIV